MKPSTILWLRSMVLFSTTVLSAAVALQYYSPPTTDLRHVASVLYSAVASWLKPPYLYLLINFIIITIAASSKLAATTTDDDDSDDAAPQPVRPLSPEYNYGSAIPADEEDKTAGFSSPGNKENDPSYQAKVRNDHKEPPPATATKLHKEYSVEEDAKPPARARFGHRRNVKASPEAVKTTTVLGVTKPRRHETLESTWKAITEGRSIPLNRHLKKSDTWERESRLSQEKKKTPQKTMMSKSETFRDGSKNVSPSSSGGSGKIKREPSLGQDELNRRVEAFIKKFNEEMRLQRQESLNQYMDLINR